MKKQLEVILELPPKPLLKSGDTTSSLLETWVHWKRRIATKGSTIALLMTGLEEGDLIEQWRRIISQYGKICFRSTEDPHINKGQPVIVMDCSLISENLNGINLSVSKHDALMQEWFILRSEAEKMCKTIYTGNSGLIFAKIRNMQTLVPIKKAKLCPIKDSTGTTFFVDARGCHGIRRYVVPDKAEILYTTEIINSQDEKEVIVMGFRINNDIILLFHPQNLVNDENHHFFKVTQNRYGSETFFQALTI